MSRKKKKRGEAEAYETVEPPPPLDPGFPYHVLPFDPAFFGADFDMEAGEES